MYISWELKLPTSIVFSISGHLMRFKLNYFLGLRKKSVNIF